MTPEAMKTNFTKLGIAGDYDFSRPTSAQPPQGVTTRTAVIDVVMETTCIHTPYGRKVQEMFGREPGFFLALNDEHDQTYKTLVSNGYFLPATLER